MRESPLTEGLSDPATFYHVHSFVPHPADVEDVLGCSEYGSPFVSVVARESVFGAQFHPEKSSTHGLALLGNFARLCAPACRRDPLPGDRHRRRQGRPPRPGALRGRDRLRRRSARRGADVGGAGRALPARRRPRRGADGPAGQPGPPRADLPRARASRSSTAAGCATWPRCATRCGPAPPRVVLGTAAYHRRRLPRRGPGRLRRRACSSPSTCAAATSRPRAGRRRRRCPPRR
ncbi:MAG: hypothetical protein WKF40_05995 [Thermoleophilaceae bacterium]